LLRQGNTALVANFNHAKKYFPISVTSIARVVLMGPLGCTFTPALGRAFLTEMRVAAALLIFAFLPLSAPGKVAREEPKVVAKVTPLPVELDSNFEFRKTKLVFLSEQGLELKHRARQETSKVGGKSNQDQRTVTLQDAPIVFERQYRLFG